MKNKRQVIPALAVILVVTTVAAIAEGAVQIPVTAMVSGIQHWLSGEELIGLQENVFIELRLPRVLLCCLVGSILAVSGVLMQGLFRNPIVEPGLVGTSSGAACGAALVFVLAAGIDPGLKANLGAWLAPLFAFGGAMLATLLVYTLAGEGKGSSVVSLLLAGIAVNAIGLSGTGFLAYIARDPQARSITFWSLGTFSGASWWQVVIVGTTGISGCLLAFRYAKQLNTLLLGEEDANYLGVDTVMLKRKIMILNTAMVAIATAFVGVISFVGLIVPHILRLLMGSDNRKLLPAAALAGAILLNLADMAARLLLAPAEIPIGIITSLVGAPIFIILLKRSQLAVTKGEHHG
ncbi:iron ABC transporter permease [Flavihumibacter rivuli]|uniref:FecCD family ABC transporter permease n=1 Tax=Flavihumibacter rivuli TaxID=2838156 RepID=UPI001BDE62D1|nr:iron ABC transporter permease [Flavihumibacter rivuli]ULQ55940.1 iron ABC transporter permease [Flavihumibacter rivuli]